MTIKPRGEKLGPVARVLIRVCLAIIMLCFAIGMNVVFELLHTPVQTHAIYYETWSTYASVTGTTGAYTVGVKDSTNFYNSCYADGTNWDTGFSGVYPRISYSSTDKWKIRNGHCKWNVSGAPDLDQIIEIRIVGFVNSVGDTGHWGVGHYYGWYQTDLSDGVVNNADYELPLEAFATPNRVTGVVDANDYITADHATWYVTESDWDVILTPTEGNYTWLALVNEHQRWGIQPGDAINGASQSLWIDNDIVTDNEKLWLEIDYIPDVEDYGTEYDSNASVDTTVTGAEVADNITWGSNRLIYTDQDLWFKVQGDSGANITVQLVDESNNVVASNSVTDSIRTDDNYDFVIDNIPSTYEGFVRARELNFGITSDWGYISPSPDSDLDPNWTYAVDPSSPQYDYGFSEYVTNRGDMMIYHWKTSLDGTTDNLSAYNLELWDRGSSSSPVFDYTLAELEPIIGGDVTGGGYDNFEQNVHWRFMLFTTGFTSGQSSYTNLIQNLNIPFEPSYKGFIQTVITDNASTEYAGCHSAYWYLTNATNGIACYTDYANYAVNSDITVMVNIGNECNVETDLPGVRIELYNDSGQLFSTDYFSVEQGENEYVIAGSDIAGSYYALVGFYSSTKTYEYIKKLSFTISGTASTGSGGGGGTGIGGWIDDRLRPYDLDNEGGHWLVLLVLMVVLGACFIRIPIVAMAIILTLFAGGLLLGWINPWFIVLLCIGGGIYVYRFIKSHRNVGV